MNKIGGIIYIFLILFLGACSPKAEIVDNGKPGQIKVIAYHDINNNDLRDQDEPGLEDRVAIGQDVSCPVQQKPTELTTGSSGIAVFADLHPGIYCVMYMGDRRINTKLTVEVYLSSEQEAQVSFGLVDENN